MGLGCSNAHEPHSRSAGQWSTGTCWWYRNQHRPGRAYTGIMEEVLPIPSQTSDCIIHVSFHYWAYHSLPFPENSYMRKVSCLEWIRMSIFCNSASKITHVSPWVLSVIINGAVKLKGSKITLVFEGCLSFIPGRSFTWGFMLYNASRLNCEYKIPCAKMIILVLLISVRLCISKGGCHIRTHFFLSYFFKKYLVIYQQLPIQRKLGMSEIFL